MLSLRILWVFLMLEDVRELLCNVYVTCKSCGSCAGRSKCPFADGCRLNGLSRVNGHKWRERNGGSGHGGSGDWCSGLRDPW